MNRIDSVVYCGWRGIDYLRVETNMPLNAFLGENGAGKSTLAIALIYALLPDRKALNVRPISDIKDASVERQDSLMGRIDPELGYAYVAMDISARNGKRLIAGIHLGMDNQRLHITPLTISGLPEFFDLSIFFNRSDGAQVYTPDLTEFKRTVAQAGYDCKGYDNLSDYLKLLHDAGILPTPMYTRADRDLFARLLETSFLGGISPEIAKNLKHYLLQEAKHIPETVRRMHECTEDVLRTQRAVTDANRQIRLVQAAFVTGRAMVSNAIAFINAQFRRDWTALAAIRTDAIMAREQLAASNREKILNDEVIDQIKASEKSVRDASDLKISQWENEISDAREKVEKAKETLETARKHAADAKAGADAWTVASAGDAGLGIDELDAKLASDIGLIQAGRAATNEDVRRLKATLDSLTRPGGDASVAALSKALNATSLESALADAHEPEARRFEAILHGTTAGVVGARLSDLASLEPRDDLPSGFWLGERLPEAGQSNTVGAWTVVPSAGGHTVFSDAHKTRFGHLARAKLAAEVTRNIERLEEEAEQQYGLPLAAALKRQRALQDHRLVIQLYLDTCHLDQKYLARIITLEEALDSHLKEILRLERALRMERDASREKSERFASQREHAAAASARAINAMGLATNTLSRCATGRGALAAKIHGRIDNMRDCKLFIREYNFSIKYQDDAALEDPPAYVAVQMRTLAELSKALEGEPPERVHAISVLNISHLTPSDCLPIWPVLMSVLQDHVPSSVLQQDGENLLGQMELRRDHLMRDLVKKQDEVKIRAREIAMSINTQISFQSRQINALSEIGSALRFGKVEGIRIMLVPKVRMIELLQKVSDDAGLFADEGRSMEEVMGDYFREAMGERLKGDEVLDYRTFVDLKLEAKRIGRNDWVPAFSLSGGEAIGAGIAIVLMLFRALANRGDYPADQLTPVFVMDEINRIDPRGQRMVVDLCELNGIQLFVTGPEMVPAKNTRMYMLARSMEPVERVIVRELRGFSA
jgi:chromosome condensin MukBEF ATPase and DNA-binding subunit MukB